MSREYQTSSSGHLQVCSALGIHLYLLYWSVQFFDFQKVVKSAAMEIPMAVVAAVMVLGFFLGSVRCLVNAVNSVRKIGDMKGKEE